MADELHVNIFSDPSCEIMTSQLLLEDVGEIQ